ncbi:MAG TPA: DUF4276 family protein [Thermoanaerobaculia bacterium]|nr:DUF4276 family protein [Thermoanaerobaculia bacterium]
MHYLRLALLAEGTSDHLFLPVVLRRLTIDLCATHAQRQVEVEDEVLDLTALRIASREPENRTERVQNILLEVGGTFNVLFIHADGGSDPENARITQFNPLALWMSQQSEFGASRSVAVIPVREMEAWTLMDGEALRNAFGTVLEDSDLGLPAKPRDVEGIVDPKRSLEDAYSKVLGRRRRRKEKTTNFFSAIAERVRLDCLRQAGAFQELERDLRDALTHLGYFR